MTKNMLLQKLKDSVSASEYAALTENTLPHINEHNRHTLLKMMASTSADETDVSDTRIKSLENILENYLGIYLSEDPSSWKWIILSCIYLSFICNLPLHPRERVHYTETCINGKIIYRCPLKSKEANTACSFCVCQPVI